MQGCQLHEYLFLTDINFNRPWKDEMQSRPQWDLNPERNIQGILFYVLMNDSANPPSF